MDSKIQLNDELTFKKSALSLKSATIYLNDESGYSSDSSSASLKSQRIKNLQHSHSEETFSLFLTPDINLKNICRHRISSTPCSTSNLTHIKSPDLEPIQGSGIKINAEKFNNKKLLASNGHKNVNTRNLERKELTGRKLLQIHSPLKSPFKSSKKQKNNSEKHFNLCNTPINNDKSIRNLFKEENKSEKNSINDESISKQLVDANNKSSVNERWEITGTKLLQIHSPLKSPFKSSKKQRNNSEKHIDLCNTPINNDKSIRNLFKEKNISTQNSFNKETISLNTSINNDKSIEYLFKDENETAEKNVSVNNDKSIKNIINEENNSTQNSINKESISSDTFVNNDKSINNLFKEENESAQNSIKNESSDSGFVDLSNNSILINNSCKISKNQSSLKLNDTLIKQTINETIQSKETPIRQLFVEKCDNCNKPCKFSNIILKLMNDATYILPKIFSYMKIEDLISISQVNHCFRKIVSTTHSLNKKVDDYFQEIKSEKDKVGKENYKNKNAIENNSHFAIPSPRKQLQQLQYANNSPSKNKNSSSLTLFEKFVREGKKLLPGETQQKCVQCQNPAKVSQSEFKAVCSKESCAFIYCIRCLLPYHNKPSECIALKPRPKITTASKILSKACKKRLRRL